MLANWTDILWTHTWWSYSRDGELPLSVAYHVFNLLEGLAWCICSGLVLLRHFRFRRSQLELWYAGAFLTFGLSDFREAYYQQTWLIWLKGLNLVVLFSLRHRVITRLYPGNRLY